MQEHQSFVRLLRRLWRHIAPRRRLQLGVLFFLMLLASFAEVVSIGAVVPFLGGLTNPEQIFRQPRLQPLISALNLTEPGQLLLPLTVAFGCAALFSGAARLLLLWAETRLSHAIGADFSISIYRRTLYQPYAVHLSRNSSEIIAGISSKANGLVNGTILPILAIISSVLMMLMIVMALVAIDPLVPFVVLLGFGSIYVLIVLATKKRLAQSSRSISREQGRVIKVVQEGLSGIRDVLIEGAQNTYCRTYLAADLPYRRAVANVQIISTSPRYVIEALGMALVAALAYGLASRPGGIATAIPVLGAMVLGAQRLLPVMQMVYSSLAHINSGRAPLEDTLELLDQPLPAYASAPPPEPIAFRRSIDLDRLSYRYKEDGQLVLKEMSLTIGKGARIGFIGKTGSGKSTLLDILMGLLSPSDGRMSVDGVAITEENQRAWQINIAHVPQAIFLSDSTIAENIAFGVPLEQIDHQRVRQAAQRAQIAEAIESWDEQYQTMVGERGIRLSGGQRQRIGIARALYRQANVIVFDEATSALDNDTEQAVMKAIDALGEELTILIVAHRLTTLKNCTQIIELGEGGVKQTGSYADVIGPLLR
ncbi:ABC transporter ATP-binding protein [Herbaspirillum chlorophenolicum]|uniref:ABC transporter ATP-binding protein n=1 Tax=Herbaspirillum chlorophenolicum TaxID=211589 RepID=A0ABW8ES44_9BURK